MEVFVSVEKLIDIGSYPVSYLLNILLADKSTKRNIIWATDTYEQFGEGFGDREQMNKRRFGGADKNLDLNQEPEGGPHLQSY
jgi:hypothetical protein